MRRQKNQRGLAERAAETQNQVSVRIGRVRYTFNRIDPRSGRTDLRGLHQRKTVFKYT